MLNLATILETSAHNHPRKTAVVCGDTRLTYRDVDELANRVANGLRAAGVQPRDSVALACPNLPQFPVIYYGILKTGAGEGAELIHTRISGDRIREVRSKLPALAHRRKALFDTSG